jgi:NAD-dependent deacetylase
MPKSSFHSIVILTGAGISAESGLGTFRDVDGLWTKVNLEDVATPQGFARDPAMVHEFYSARRKNIVKARPNAAHIALARLEAEHPGEVLIVTQNVDNLHERGGSENVLHMHGELLKIRCANCGDIRAWFEDLFFETPCPACRKPNYLRPYVVWFGEMPFETARIEQALADCDLFLSIGTSGNVYPAAGYVAMVRERGVRERGRAHSVELNLEPSDGAAMFAEAIYGRATEIVPAYVEGLLNKSA